MSAWTNERHEMERLTANRKDRERQIGSGVDPTINREDETDRGNFAIRGRIHRLGSRLYFSLATYPHPPAVNDLRKPIIILSVRVA